MKTRSIEISRLFSTGDFENVKIGYVIELEVGDNLDVVRRDLLTQIDKDLDLVKERKRRTLELERERRQLKHRLGTVDLLIKEPNLVDPDGDDLPF